MICCLLRLGVPLVPDIHPEDKKASSKEIVLFLLVCFKSNKHKKHPQGLWGSSQDWMDTGYLGRTGQEGKEGNCPVCGIAAGMCGAVPGEGDEPARAPGAGAEHHGTNGACCPQPQQQEAVGETFFRKQSHICRYWLPLDILSTLVSAGKAKWHQQARRCPSFWDVLMITS